MATTPSLTFVLGWIGRLTLGATFVYAAALKIIDPATFIAAIGHYRLLPYPIAVALGVYLPWVELFCGVAVLVRRFEQGALRILVAFCGLFGAALASALDTRAGHRLRLFWPCPHHDFTPLAFGRCLALATIAFLLTRSPRPRGNDN